MKDTLCQSSKEQPEISDLSFKISIITVTRFTKASEIGEGLTCNSSRQRIDENTVEVYLTSIGKSAANHHV